MKYVKAFIGNRSKISLKYRYKAVYIIPHTPETL